MAASAEEIAELRATYQAYVDAERAVLRNRSYEMADGRSMTRESLKEIRLGKKQAKAELDAALGCGQAVGRMRRGIPLVR